MLAQVVSDWLCPGAGVQLHSLLVMPALLTLLYQFEPATSSKSYSCGAVTNSYYLNPLGKIVMQPMIFMVVQKSTDRAIFVSASRMLPQF